MSINHQVAGWEGVAILRCEKIQSTHFPNKADLLHLKTSALAQLFLIHFGKEVLVEIGGGYDDAARDRASLSRV